MYIRLFASPWLECFASGSQTTKLIHFCLRRCLFEEQMLLLVKCGAIHSPKQQRAHKTWHDPNGAQRDIRWPAASSVDGAQLCSPSKLSSFVPLCHCQRSAPPRKSSGNVHKCVTLPGLPPQSGCAEHLLVVGNTLSQLCVFPVGQLQGQPSANVTHGVPHFGESHTSAVKRLPACISMDLVSGASRAA